MGRMQIKAAIVEELNILKLIPSLFLVATEQTIPICAQVYSYSTVFQLAYVLNCESTFVQPAP